MPAWLHHLAEIFRFLLRLRQLRRQGGCPFAEQGHFGFAVVGRVVVNLLKPFLFAWAGTNKSLPIA